MRTFSIPRILAFQDLCPDQAKGLFESMRNDQAAEWFQPHGFTAEDAVRLLSYEGPDVYTAITLGAQPAAYGLLRGWEQGFEVPSLGIFVASFARGTGLARMFMHYLHAIARLRGAQSVRLRVCPENRVARALYERLGYCFSGEDRGQLEGLLRLSGKDG